MIREQIRELANLGPLPDSEADADRIVIYEDLLASISPPVTDEEAGLLVKTFGSDDCYGLAWTLLHLIETAPSWPIKEYLQGNNDWIDLLRTRSENAKAS
jgi:hypothetical protein